MKRFLSVLLIIYAVICFSPTSVGYIVGQAEANDGESIPSIEAQGAILIEKNSEKILYAKNEKQRLYPASTTKILTALVVLENTQAEEVITVGEEIKQLDSSGSTAGLVLGQEITVGDLLRGLMLSSGNDAANVLAVHTARKVAGDSSLSWEEALNNFAALMNKRARGAGAKNSNFTNPHGLHQEKHYITAYDLAKIAEAAMENSRFREIVQLNKYGEWINTNKLLNKNSRYYYQYATGIKTGHTTPAGCCLVSSAAANNLDLIAVVLNTTPAGQWKDSTNLLEYGLKQFKRVQLLKAGQEVTTVKVANPAKNDSGEIAVLATLDFIDVFQQSQIPEIKKQIIWDKNLMKVSGEEEKGLKAPLAAGQELGKVVYMLKDKVIVESALVAGKGVRSNNFLLNIMGNRSSALLSWVIGSIVLLLILRKRYAKKKLRRKRF